MVPSLDYLLLPLIVSLPLVISHVYFGQYILQRGIIFVDIAIAQIALLGMTFAFYLGYSPSHFAVEAYGLIFSLGAALLLAFAKPKEEEVPQEAIIGIVYVLASGLAILLVDMAEDPHGAEKIRFMLVGNITWVTWHDLGKLLLYYFPLAVFHALFFPKIYATTFYPAQMTEKSIRVWDFWFYLTFGITVTQSVRVCGVLLVFSYLVIPAVCTRLFLQNFWFRYLSGVLIGIGITFLGLLFSWNHPSGSMIVLFFGILLGILGMVKFLLTSQKPLLSFFKLTALIFGFILSLGVLYILFSPAHHHFSLLHHALKEKPSSSVTLRHHNWKEQVSQWGYEVSKEELTHFLLPLSSREKKELLKWIQRESENLKDVEKLILFAKLKIVMGKEKQGKKSLKKLLEASLPLKYQIEIETVLSSW